MFSHSGFHSTTRLMIQYQFVLFYCIGPRYIHDFRHCIQDIDRLRGVREGDFAVIVVSAACFNLPDGVTEERDTQIDLVLPSQHQIYGFINKRVDRSDVWPRLFYCNAIETERRERACWIFLL